jgi:hypothetical protein
MNHWKLPSHVGPLNLGAVRSSQLCRSRKNEPSGLIAEAVLAPFVIEPKGPPRNVWIWKSARIDPEQAGSDER